MPTTFEVQPYRAADLERAMQVHAAKPNMRIEGFYAISVTPGVAMLVEPVNANTFIFELPNIIHEFAHQAGSGTDALRQRALATREFEAITARAAAKRATPAMADASKQQESLLAPGAPTTDQLAPPSSRSSSDAHLRTARP